MADEDLGDTGRRRSMRTPLMVGSVAAGVVVTAALRLTSTERSLPAAASIEASRAPAAISIDEAPRGASAPSPPFASSRLSASASPPNGPAEPPASTGFGEVDAVGATRERDAQVSALRASGSDSARGRASRDVAAAFKRLVAGRGAPVKAEPFECYQGGCFVTVVARTSRVADDVSSDVVSSPDVQSWWGPQSRSTPIVHANGSVELTWFFLAAADGGQAP
jgi:hypothetical protein